MADDVPASQPAEMAYSPRTAQVSVMVLPFHLIGSTADGAWISQAIDEDLRTELMKNPAVSVVPAPAKLPGNAPDALQAGLWGNAKYVIYGTYQLANGQVRVTGSIISVADGRIAAPLSATGDVRDLFKMEDDLTAQLQQVLPSQPSVADIQTNAPETDQTTYYYPYEDQAATADNGYYESPAVVYAYPDYYPAYNGWFIGGVGVFGGGFDHRGFDHRDFDGRGFDGRGRGFVHVGFGPGPVIGRGFGGGGVVGGFRGGAFGGGFRGGGFGGGFHGGGFGGGFHGGGFGGHR